MKKQEQGSGAGRAGVRGQGPEKRRRISAAAVRGFLREFPQSTALEVEERLPVQTHQERNRVKQILHDLVKTGGAVSVTHLGATAYRLTAKPGRGAVQAKLWRFACLRSATGRPFTAAEAAGMADCARDYAKKYCRWLWRSAHLAIISRRAGESLYQVMAGKENLPAPAWNRRAEKRKSVGQTPSPAGLPARAQEEIPPGPPLLKGGELADKAARLDAALEEFGAALVEVTGSIGVAWGVIRAMKGELLALREKLYDEPGEPTAGGD